MNKPVVEEYFFKRVIDFSLALIGTILSSVLWFIITLAILVDDGKPVLFLQERCGRYGKRFEIIKFRTMKSFKDADKNHKIVDIDKDPRVTRVGKLLRDTAMDELPVLINILVGQMSFVGPRPLPYYIEDEDKVKYDSIVQVPGYELRSQFRPGLTGYAQVYASKNIDHAAKFNYDNQYLGKMSLWFDIKLIFLSLGVTLAAKWEHRGNKV